MAKTNPIGVRFRTDILEKLEKDHGVDSPQKALVFLERFFVAHNDLAKDVTQVLRDNPPSDKTGAKKGLKLPKIDLSEKKVDLTDEKRDLSEVKVVDLTNQRPKTNFTINTKPKKEMPAGLSRTETLRWMRENN